MNHVRFRITCLVGALALVALAPAPPALAAKSGLRGVAVLQTPAPPAEASFLRGNQRISVETGAPLALYHVGYRVVPDAPEAMAAQFLRDHADLLRLAAPDLGDLVPHATWASPAGTTVRFRQQVGGVPVYGAEIAVTVDPTATVDFVMNGYRPGLEGVDVVPGLAAAEARGAAFDRLGVAGEVSFERTRLVVFAGPGSGGAAPRLAWEVRVVPAGSPVGDWEVLVDAHTGEIFQVADRALYVDGNGNVFNPDPLSSAHVSYGAPAFVDGSDADTAQLTGQLVNVTLRDITLAAGTYTLTGPWAAINDAENPKKGLFGQATSTFNFTRFQDAFEAVNTYHHIDTFMRHVNVTLGLNIHPFQYSGGVQFDPHGLNGADNSHYTPSTGRLAFGEGGVDDAEDADVVIHELGHGLHDWVTSGSASQVNGLGEGTGDYLAASYSRAFGQWAPGDPQFQWVFNWDGHNPFWAGRVTNYPGVYPGDLVGQIHTDGQIWSTCLMKIWDLIGRNLTDKAVLAGLGMTNSNTNQQDAAQAVLTAAVNMSYSGANVATMESTFQGCGYQVTAPCTATCGNNTIECSEVCDGTALGGATCGSQGCTGGGTLACNASCTGFDTSGCFSCSACDNDGTCELGEDCNGCPADCPSGTTSGAICGNGICEAGNGENCVTCAADCNGKQNGSPGGRFCCGDGGGQNPVPCSDARCSTGGFSCTTVPANPGSFCCGDLTCGSGESCGTCALDCSTGAEVCTGGADEDCDGAVDCSDADCIGDPACSTSCGGSGAACSSNAQCCSGNCKGNGTCK